MFNREKTREVLVGNVKIGAKNPISVQSMTKTKTSDIDSTVKQILQLEEAGCQIVRCAVPDMHAAKALKAIKEQIHIPLVADIHFNHEYALVAADSGVDKLRINPGNIGDPKKIKLVVDSAKEHKIPIRIGVNSGSLDKKILNKYKGHVTAEGLVQSALDNVRILEKLKFKDIIISIKATNIPMTIKAYELIAQKVNYPLHVGITEAGIPGTGTIRSSVGIGAILAKGLGNTIRVSLTGDPLEEVKVGLEILRSLHLAPLGVNVISCPTCGRTDINVYKIAKEIEDKTRHIKQPLTVAIMGCEVNGPGEAAKSDIGLAGGRGVGLIFRQGKIIKKVNEAEMIKALLDEIELILKQKEK